MSVDKFGRDTSVGTTTTSGVSVRYINDNFLRKDGTIPATGPLNMDNNRISNVVDPIDEQDVTTKNYVDENMVSKLGDTITGPLKVQDSAGSSTILNDRLGLSVIGGNVAIGIAAGGPEIDIKQAGEVYGSGLRIRDSSNLKHCQFGWVANKFSLYRVDQGQSYGDKIFSVHNERLTELKDPVNNQDVATKAYVDANSAQRKPIIAVWAEQSGALTNGNYEWSFGNGASGATHRHAGYPIPASGRILRMSFACAYSRNEIVVALLINGSEQPGYVIRTPGGRYSNCITFDTPLEVEACSRINFKSKSSDSQVDSAVVTVLIELDV